MENDNQAAEVVTCELVGPDDALDVPVGPEEVVIEHREGEGVRSVLSLQHHVLVVAFEVRIGDVVLKN